MLLKENKPNYLSMHAYQNILDFLPLLLQKQRYIDRKTEITYKLTLKFQFIAL